MVRSSRTNHRSRTDICVIPDRPGWGTEPKEDVIRSRPPNEYLYGAGLFMYGQKQP